VLDFSQSSKVLWNIGSIKQSGWQKKEEKEILEMPDDDWRPHRVNGPDDNNNDDRSKAVLVFLPIPQELKDKGLKAVTYARTFISVDYNGKLFTFTVHKDDVTKTKAIFDKELDHEVDTATKSEIWFKVITSNWLLHIYTEDEIQRDALRSEGNSEIILETAKKNSRLIFLDEYKTPHAAVMVNEHLEVLPIAETRFKNWLRMIIAKEYKINVISSTVIDEVANALVAEALFDISGTKEKSLGLRFASDPDGDEFKWFYDLSNKDHEFIAISPEGYKTVKNIIVFRRFNHQLPQVYPDPTYSVDIFDQFMNLLNVKKEDRLILKCYIVATFIPNLEKAVLMVHGEQGTAKSMLEALLVMLISPTLMKTVTPQTKLDQFVQLLSHHPVVYFDNLSRIPEWMSNLLCRAVTGDAFSKRKHYTNDDDVIYVLMRAIGFNGINLAATKPDLLDRGLIIQTDSIPDDNKRLKSAIWKEFYRIRPQLLGYIMDILVKVLKWKKDNPNTALVKKLPRMADWGEWCEIVAHCMGEDEGAFMKDYRANINLQTEEVIEGSDLAIAIRELADLFDDKEPQFRGTPTELLLKLNLIADAKNIDRRNKYWPKTAARLSRSLKLLQRTLREIGVQVRWEKDKSTKNNTRIIVIAKLPSEPSDRPIDENQAQNNGKSSDDRSDSDIKLPSDKDLPSDKKGENCA
jgi:hypothetical protein